MPANASISLNDGQATPVAHTFVPMSAGLRPDKDATMAFEYEDKSPSTPEGFKRLEIQYAKPTAQRKSAKVLLKIVDPKVESISINGGTAVPTVTRNNIVEVAFTFDKKSTESERKDVLAYVKNALANTIVDDVVERLELPY